MIAKVLHIEERNREQLQMPLSLECFTVTEGGEVDTDFIIDQPSVSLCCFDDANYQAIFAELPPGIDPAQIPFFYQAQFEHAHRLYAVSYDVFFDLARSVNPACSRFVFIHNIGRCGSTLLHKALNNCEEITSLSEPDVLGQVHYLRTANGREDSRLFALMRSSLPLLFKESAYPSQDVGVIKLRNQCVNDIDLFCKAFPDAQHLFVYRSVEGWVGSLYARRLRWGTPLKVNLTESHAMWESYHNRSVLLEEYGLGDLPATISMVENLTISWLLMMDSHLRFYDHGYRMPTLRYEDLNTKKREALEALFSHLNLSMSGVSEALRAFDEDSQAGTRLARPDPKQGSAISFSESQFAQMESILDRHARIRSVRYIAPDAILL